MVDTLYHYSSNQGCFGILDSRQIWMSDIRKSNDDNEMLLMYPQIIDEILYQYRENPFPFKYKEKYDIDAVYELLSATEDMVTYSIKSGDFSSFVTSFSETPDLLSQWRGYANDGKGCCLGFSSDLLEDYCTKSNEVLQLKQVRYITAGERMKIVEQEASEILSALKTLRPWIVDNMTFNDDDATTEGLLLFNFHYMIDAVLINSLEYKDYGFSEEKEWRLFLTNQAYKKPDWVLGEDEELIGPNGFAATIKFLRNKIQFNIKEDNISAFVPVSFDEFESMPVTEIWTGPKSKIMESDLKLYLKQKGYPDVKINQSSISYR